MFGCTSMELEGSRGGAHRRRGSPADEGRGGATRLAGGGARAPCSPCSLLLLPLGRVCGGSRREEDGGGHPGHGGACHLPPHIPRLADRVRGISIFLLSAAPPPYRDTRRARGGRELSSAMEVVAPFPTSRPLPLLSTAPAHHLRLLPPPFVSGRQLHPSPRHQGRERERVARRGRGYRAAMATDEEREGSRSKMRAREGDGE